MTGRCLAALACLVSMIPQGARADRERLEDIVDIPVFTRGDDRVAGITLAPIEDGRLGEVGYGSAPCARALDEIADLGASWISLTPFGRMDDVTSVDIQHDFEIPVSDNEQMMRDTARLARDRGLRVALIPHIYVMSGGWRGRIEPDGPMGWRRWFDEYERFVLRFAKLAEEIGADLFSIGVEFKSSSNFRERDWRRIISKVRESFTGPLTYSANWDEVDEVAFWDALDLLGVNGFWPLAQKPGDGLDEMSARSKAVASELERLYARYGKPVLLTEFGVKSATDAAVAPWEWPEHCGELSYDEEYQARAYHALLSTLSQEPWFAGLFVWKYFSDPYDETQEAPAGFSPRGKSAESVLSCWLSAPSDCFSLDPLGPLQVYSSRSLSAR